MVRLGDVIAVVRDKERAPSEQIGLVQYGSDVITVARAQTHTLTLTLTLVVSRA